MKDAGIGVKSALQIKTDVGIKSALKFRQNGLIRQSKGALYSYLPYK